MKHSLNSPPRVFDASGVSIKDFGKISLDADEMISVVSESGKECDVTGKEWGFYLAPSLNGRLKNQGFKVALVRNKEGKLFINAVEIEKMKSFIDYLRKNHESEILCWLDEWVD